LRGDFYKSVLVGYLLCRILDTVEDSSFFDFSHQESLITGFAGFFRSETYEKHEIQKWTDRFFAWTILKPDEDDYYELVKNAWLVIANYSSLPDKYRKAVKDCVVEMADGMLEMARSKSTSNDGHFIESGEDLDRYCYYVAGTVGILTTRLLQAYTGRIDEPLYQFLRERSIFFGLGLQMTNILKDCWSDRQRGICYLPRDLLSVHDIEVDDFFLPANRAGACRVIDELVRNAAQNLDKGLELILAVPKSQYRVRLSCLWPLFFAVLTLAEIKKNPGLLDGRKTRISRTTVKKLIRMTSVLAISNRGIKVYYKRYREQL
jgi:farnesyl-diphosphate farnesyltransferase